MIPLPYKAAGIALALTCLFGAGWYAGTKHVQREWDAAKAVQEQHTDHVQAAQAAVTVQTVTQYVDRIKTVTAPAQEVLRVIPTYLPVDAQCPAAGTVGMLIKSAEDGVPIPATPGPTDGSTSTAADLATWGVEAVAACKANSEQLSALQQWVMAQGAIK